MNTDSVLETLHANGYLTNIADGADVEVLGARQRFFYADGVRQYFRDPAATLAVLQFEVGEASPLATKFVHELVRLVAPADKLLRKVNRPLVRTTATTLHAIYQTDGYVALCDNTLQSRVGRPMFDHGLSFPDGNPYAGATLVAGYGRFDLGGTWLDQRSPSNTPRASLPVWNGDELAKMLRAFVDEAVAAGEIRELGPYIAPPPAPTWSYGEPTRNDTPAPIQYTDERLAKSFGVSFNPEFDNPDDIATRRRG